MLRAAWSRCIPAPSPAITLALSEWPVPSKACAKPVEVASAATDRLAPAEPPSLFATPATARAASSTADVWVARREIEVTGRGFEWEGQEGRMNIQSNARVVLKTLSVRPAVERGVK